MLAVLFASALILIVLGGAGFGGSGRVVPAFHHGLRPGSGSSRHPSDGRRRGQLSAAGRAVLHSRRQPDEHGRHHRPHLRFRQGGRRLDAGRAGPRQHRGLGDLRRHVGGGGGRRRRARHHRDPGPARRRIRSRILGRGDGGLLDHRSDHSSVAAHGRLRGHRIDLDRQAVRGRFRSRPVDGGRADGHGPVVRAPAQLPPRRPVSRSAIWGGPSRAPSCR